MKTYATLFLSLFGLTCHAQYHEIQKIWNPASPSSNYYGWDIDIYENKCAILAYGEHYVEIREFNGEKWEFRQTIYPEGTDHLYSVAFNDDFVIIGRPYEDKDAIPLILESGYVYVYKWNGSKYVFFQKILSPFGGMYNHFGRDVKLVGNRFLATNEGAEKVVTYKFNGTAWVLEQYIHPSLPLSSFTIELTEQNIFLGLLNATVGANANQGLIIEFDYDGAAWVEDQQFWAAEGVANEQLGERLYATGDQLITGTDDYNGKAYIFEKIGGEWTETAKLECPDPSMTNFGSDVAIDNERCFVSGVNEFYEASVYYFTRIDGEWVHQQTLTASDQTKWDNYGDRIEISGNHILGACDRHNNVSDEPSYRGAVYAHYFCAPLSSSFSETICDGDTYVFQSDTLTEAGIYSDTLTTILGCDSVITLTLNVTEIDLSITETDLSLTANETGATYQWKDCSTGFAIAGATSASYFPAASGTYACTITKSGCTATTACIFIDISSCTTPTSITATMITSGSAKISWTAVAGATKYQVQYRPAGAGAWTTVNATSTSKNLTGLTSNQLYEYRVRTICGAESSDYSAIFNFTTLP